MLGCVQKPVSDSMEDAPNHRCYSIVFTFHGLKEESSASRIVRQETERPDSFEVSFEL